MLVPEPLWFVLYRLTECDRESASNTAVAGYSLTGSVASSYLGQHRYQAAITNSTSIICTPALPDPDTFC